MDKFLILYFTFLLLFSSCCKAEKIVIDTDGGADDAQAILLLLRAEANKKMPSPFKVIAITCTYGNTDEDYVETNILKTLTVAGRTDIPVYPGAKKPLIGKFSTDRYFGVDGFGNSRFDRKIGGRIDKSKHAAVALIELTKQHKGNISVVVLGPTTNVALATSLDLDFTSRIIRYYVMGSSVSGYGLYKPNVEFNFAADPESNSILLNSSPSPSKLTIFPWEASYHANCSMEWRKNVFGKLKSPYVDFMNTIEAVVLSREDEVLYAAADTMAMAAMLRPDVIAQETLETRVEAVTDGAARGSVLVDYRPIRFHEKPDNTKIVLRIDLQKFQELMIEMFTCNTIEC